MTHSGGKPHTNIGDKGQRYEIRYTDDNPSNIKVFGWTDDLETAARMCKSIELHPTMQNPVIFDRKLNVVHTQLKKEAL